MHDFFIHCSIRLGKTQVEFENGYYITDILDVMETLDKHIAEDLLSNLNVQVAGSGLMAENDYKNYIEALRKQAQLDDNDNSDEFNRSSIEMLRQKLGK